MQVDTMWNPSRIARAKSNNNFRITRSKGLKTLRQQQRDLQELPAGIRFSNNNGEPVYAEINDVKKKHPPLDDIVKSYPPPVDDVIPATATDVEYRRGTRKNSSATAKDFGATPVTYSNISDDDKVTILELEQRRKAAEVATAAVASGKQSPDGACGGKEDCFEAPDFKLYFPTGRERVRARDRGARVHGRKISISSIYVRPGDVGESNTDVQQNPLYNPDIYMY